jgi:hypothetical protein
MIVNGEEDGMEKEVVMACSLVGRYLRKLHDIHSWIHFKVEAHDSHVV